MSAIQTKLKLFATVLLSFLLIGVGASSPSNFAHVSSSGTIVYSMLTLVNFENDDCFMWGIDGNGTGYILYGTEYSGNVPFWSRGAWPAKEYPGVLLFEPATSIVYSGLHSAELSVTDTSKEATRRLEILHDWDPYTEYIWQVGFYYFPSSLKPSDGWITFHRIIYERMWDQNKAIYYQYFQISLSVMTDSRSATYGQQIFVLSLGKGNVDNNNDRVEEYWPYYETDLFSNGDSSKTVPASWLTKKPGFQVPFDRWFKVTTLVFRNITDFNNGYVKVWIDGELIWDIQGTRTLGIAPSVLENVDPLPPQPQGYLCSGFGLYTEIGSKPKTIFADSIIISNSSQIWLAP